MSKYSPIGNTLQTIIWHIIKSRGTGNQGVRVVSNKKEGQTLTLSFLVTLLSYSANWLRRPLPPRLMHTTYKVQRGSLRAKYALKVFIAPLVIPFFTKCTTRNTATNPHSYCLFTGLAWNLSPPLSCLPKQPPPPSFVSIL